MGTPKCGVDKTSSPIGSPHMQRPGCSLAISTRSSFVPFHLFTYPSSMASCLCSASCLRPFLWGPPLAFLSVTPHDFHSSPHQSTIHSRQATRLPFSQPKPLHLLPPTLPGYHLQFLHFPLFSLSTLPICIAIKVQLVMPQLPSTGLSLDRLHFHSFK